MPKPPLCVLLFLIASALHAVGAQALFAREGPAGSAQGAAPSSPLALEVTSQAVTGGGGEVAGGDYGVTTGLSQPVAGRSSSCAWSFSAGIWAGPGGGAALFCDGFETGTTGSWSSTSGVTAPVPPVDVKLGNEAKEAREEGELR